jgi:hypothetical protein
VEIDELTIKSPLENLFSMLSSCRIRRVRVIGCLPQYLFATNSFWAGNLVRISVP